jgi:GTP cyclohydrolase II
MLKLQQIASSKLPTPFSEFGVAVFDAGDGKEHVVLSMGDLSGPPALFSLRCDCGAQLEAALERIAIEGRGAVLYLRQEGRGIGLGNKIKAYALQDAGADTVEANHQLGLPADAREYGLAVALLRHLGLTRIRLMTNNPRKLDALAADGIEVTERVALETGRNPHNAAYLDTKRRKLGHLIDLP